MLVYVYVKLNEYIHMYMKIYQRSRSFLDLSQSPKATRISLISNSFCPEATRQTEVKLHVHVEPS